MNMHWPLASSPVMICAIFFPLIVSAQVILVAQ